MSAARIAVLTSGGNAGGMNPAVRAVVRSGRHHGLDVFAVYEGYRGLVEGGDAIRRMESSDVGGILQLGGTVIGTARCPEFRTREGRLRAARNLVDLGIAALAVIGGDGSLTGADTALHRIVEALDALDSTASSHRRSFAVEVVGRHCGCLALVASLASGAIRLLLPERPQEDVDWAKLMCSAMRTGRESGRRRNLLLVAEGAHDDGGARITVDDVRHELESRLAEDVRVTILGDVQRGRLWDARQMALGHVQKGGNPSPFDRIQATRLRALRRVPVQQVESGGRASAMIGFRSGRLQFTDLICYPELIDDGAQRPREQHWMAQRPLSRIVSTP